VKNKLQNETEGNVHFRLVMSMPTAGVQPRWKKRIRKAARRLANQRFSKASQTIVKRHGDGGIIRAAKGTAIHQSADRPHRKGEAV